MRLFLVYTAGFAGPGHLPLTGWSGQAFYFKSGIAHIALDAAFCAIGNQDTPRIQGLEHPGKHILCPQLRLGGWGKCVEKNEVAAARGRKRFNGANGFVEFIVRRQYRANVPGCLVELQEVGCSIGCVWRHDRRVIQGGCKRERYRINFKGGIVHLNAVLVSPQPSQQGIQPCSKSGLQNAHFSGMPAEKVQTCLYKNVPGFRECPMQGVVRNAPSPGNQGVRSIEGGVLYGLTHLESIVCPFPYQM